MNERSHAAEQQPSTIGRYQIVGTLGIGAMGAVYRAYDPVIGRTIAIKTIRLDIPRGSPQYPAFLDRFYHEARISGTLSHPHIVTLFDIGEDNGLPFLAMEFVEGETIAASLDRGVRFAPDRVIGIVEQVASALDYAHSRGVIHRDIKPSNLILSSGDRVKVSDFGIAKLADAELTQTGQLLGTPSYMSPEQALGEKLDGRSDTFSLGACAFEMLSGEQPFPGSNVTAVLYKLVHVDPVEPANLESSGLLPDRWRAVFRKVLAKRPEARHPTSGAFVQDLRECLRPAGMPETVALHGIGRPEPVSTGPEIPPIAAWAPPAAIPGTPRAYASESATLVLEDAGDVPTPPGPETPPETVLLPPAAPPASARASSQTQPALRPDRAAPSSASPAARRRLGRSAGVLLATAAASFVLAAGLLSWTVWQRMSVAAALVVEPTPAAATPVPAPVPPPILTGSLRVESEPRGARVLVDGEERGQTPLTVPELPLGARAVRVELRGHEPQTHDVVLDASAPNGELRVALLRRAPGLGEADLTSTPSGAAVAIDSRVVGRTPLSGVKLSPGIRRIQMTLEGYEPWTGTVDVVAGRRAQIDAPLETVARATPAPTPEPVDAARVYRVEEVDGSPRKLSGFSPAYPSGRAARLKSGQSVSVVVSFVVTETGRIDDVQVVESGGPVIDEVVVAAVRGWTYRPATRKGTPVKVRTLFKQTFIGG